MYLLNSRKMKTKSGNWDKRLVLSQVGIDAWGGGGTNCIIIHHYESTNIWPINIHRRWPSWIILKGDKVPRLETTLISKVGELLEGVESAWGIIIDIRANQKRNYIWGLGKDLDNQAEAYALLQGIKVASLLSVNNLMVFGDSSMVIQHLHYNTTPKDCILTQINKDKENKCNSSKRFDSTTYSILSTSKQITFPI